MGKGKGYTVKIQKSFFAKATCFLPNLKFLNFSINEWVFRPLECTFRFFVWSLKDALLLYCFVMSERAHNLVHEASALLKCLHLLTWNANICEYYTNISPRWNISKKLSKIGIRGGAQGIHLTIWNSESASRTTSTNGNRVRCSGNSGMNCSCWQLLYSFDAPTLQVHTGRQCACFSRGIWATASSQ